MEALVEAMAPKASVAAAVAETAPVMWVWEAAVARDTGGQAAVARVVAK
jgi:hypothetical protein